MKPQNKRIKSIFALILADMSISDVQNNIFASVSNAVSDYLNDYSQQAIDDFIDDYAMPILNSGLLADNDLTIEDIEENPNMILDFACTEFLSAFYALFSNHDSESVYDLLKNAYFYFDTCTDANFYVYADTVSNSITRWYVIRANDESEAFEILLCEFQKHFDVSESETAEESQEYERYVNDNGVYCDIDNLMFYGNISFHE